MPVVEQQSVYVKRYTLSTDTLQQFQTTSEANLEHPLDAKQECKSHSGLDPYQYYTLAPSAVQLFC